MPQFIIYSNTDGTLGVISPAHVPSIPAGRPYVIATDPVFPSTDVSTWRIDPSQLVNAAGPATITVEVPAPTATDVIAERQRRILQGKTISTTGGPNVQLAGDDGTRSDLQALVTIAQMRLAASDTSTLKVRGKDGTIHTLTPTQVVELWVLGVAFIQSVIEASWVIEALDPIPLDYADNSRWPS